MFGAFTFGRLVKIVLPGAVLVVDVILLVDVVGRKPLNGSALVTSGAAIAAIVPAVVVVGLMLNAFVFVYQRPIERLLHTDDGELAALEGHLHKINEQVLQGQWDRVVGSNHSKGWQHVRSQRRRFPVILQCQPLELERLQGKLIDYKDFQVTLAIALVPTVPIFASWSIWSHSMAGEGAARQAVVALSGVAVMVYVIWLCAQAAQRNRYEHRKGAALCNLVELDNHVPCLNATGGQQRRAGSDDSAPRRAEATLGEAGPAMGGT